MRFARQLLDLASVAGRLAQIGYAYQHCEATEGPKKQFRLHFMAKQFA